jgi:hypothetical protein
MQNRIQHSCEFVLAPPKPWRRRVHSWLRLEIFPELKTRSLPALARSYPCHFTFYLGHPHSHGAWVPDSFLIRTFLLVSQAASGHADCQPGQNP